MLPCIDFTYLFFKVEDVQKTTFEELNNLREEVNEITLTEEHSNLVESKIIISINNM